MKATLAPGARVIIRSAEWLVRRVDRTSSGSQALRVIGLSELVRDQERIFLDSLETAIDMVDPRKTLFVADESPYYRQTRLYLESLLRQTPPTDNHLYVGHKAAMDAVPYQLDPAIRALQEPRQRILIADAVGLGKTIECGVLLSELIKRGKGKRILVLAVKSMLTQFQKELWARFSIPLVRLDSVGIQRVRNRIPANHNPLYYYDRTIISIDTLKQESEYRTFLEKGYWDIIVIDEAHNVAERTNHSKRAKLAKLLASRSDTLIMLSATPHDGRKKSFASLMNMLNPTAIVNPEDYGPEDIQGLFIRRFKKDIKDQVAQAFPERVISIDRAQATSEEEAAYDILVNMAFSRLDRKGSGHILFRTTLEKALFSSPAACRETIGHRIHKLQQEGSVAALQDVQQLQKLDEALAVIQPEHFSKFQRLVQVIKDKKAGLGWTAKDTADRLVIFTERVETLRYLHEHLPRVLKLKEKQVAVMHGSMSDQDMQNTVDNFGNESSPLRLLICSDVASEGINLHYCSHRMIHFDIPWSLMVFQQRNGRVDRYGQEQRPDLRYLITDSTNDKIKGDNRILELLIQKDQEVVESIGDPSEFTGCYDVETEEIQTGKAIEKHETPEQFEQELAGDPDPLAILFGETPMPTGESAAEEKRNIPTIFASDYTYAKEALGFIGQQQDIQYSADDDNQLLCVTPTPDLKHRLKYLPPEILPDGGQLNLIADKERMQQEIKRCRKESEDTWPQLHLLWEQHPLLEYLNDKVVSAFGRKEAPVLCVGDALPLDELVYLVYALIPNRKSQPVIHQWYGVRYKNGQYVDIKPVEYWIDELHLGSTVYPNAQDVVDSTFYQSLLNDVVTRTEEEILNERQAWEDRYNPMLNEQLTRLDQLKAGHYEQLELQFDTGSLTERRQNEKEQRSRAIDRMFDEYMQWIEDSMTTEKVPYIRIVALLKGAEAC
ncbi:MAG: DEAD/DEAH box helicase [Verrucomicrobiae bacterium]|nr:DEAD/DEAH box helicase [Verrucomicrobiae bacterium]